MIKLGRVLLLSALVVVASLAGAGRSFADTTKLQQAAQKEGELTWYVASIDTRNAEAAGRAFTLKYGPKVNVVRASPQVLFQRLTHDLSEKSRNADIFSSVDTGNFVTLKQNGALMSYKPENAAKLLPPFRTLDKDDTFRTTIASLVALGYNKAKLTREEAPKSWAELTSSTWVGKIALANPAFSRFTADWAAQMNKLYGKQYFLVLQKQKLQVDRSVADAVKLVAAGERLITVSPMAPLLESADEGRPIGVVYPNDGSILVTTPSAILKSAPHPNAAKLFMEFMLGPEFGNILVEARYESMRADVIPLAGAKSVTEIKVIRPTIEETTKGVAQVARLWHDVFGP
jgi:iron(III) transport system substrate-binding protein